MKSKIYSAIFVTSILAFALIAAAGITTTVFVNVYAQGEGANQTMQEAGQQANQTGEGMQEGASNLGSKVTEGAKDLAGNIGDKLENIGK